MSEGRSKAGDTTVILKRDVMEAFRKASNEKKKKVVDRFQAHVARIDKKLGIETPKKENGEQSAEKIS